MVPTDTKETETAKVQRLAEASGLPAAEVEEKISAGLVFHQEYDFAGNPEGEGEWLDASGTTILVAGGGYWGQGNTLEAAKANFRKFGGSLGRGYVVVTFGPGSRFMGVGPMGWHWLGERPESYDVAPRKSSKK